MKYVVRFDSTSERFPWAVWATPARLVGAFTIEADAVSFATKASGSASRSDWDKPVAAPEMRPLTPSDFKLRLLKL